MAKIALVSDVHLGTRQYGLKERYDDFLVAFENARQAIVDEKVDGVVVGGDLFDSPRPDAQSVLQAQYVVKALEAAGIETFGIDGNHDLSDCGWLRAVGIHPLYDGIVVDRWGVKIVGINYKNGRDLIAAIKEMADAGVKADILVMHFALAEMNGGGSADTGVQELSPLLDRLGVKAVLMGHVHIPDVRKWNGVLYVNPGSTEMKSANEPKEKYFMVLDTETWEAEAVPLNTRHVGTFEITGEGGIEELVKTFAAEKEVRKELRTFWHIIVDDTIEDAYKRVAQVVHDYEAVARIVVRSSKARDLAPVVDRKESVATLASAIEARFPKESAEARLTADLLHSPEPASIHLICERFMKEEPKP